MSTADHDLRHLSPAAAGLGYALARPRAIAIGSILSLAALGWFWLGLMAAQEPGVWSALCRPQFGTGVEGRFDFVVVLLMWCAMVLAMMVPSAAPMILTYAEIADTAACKRQRVVSPFVLTAGYAVVWLGFAAVAALGNVAFARFAAFNFETTSAGGLASGAIFIGAGLYQYSPLKQACLRLCRAPFQFFFVNWSTTARGVFYLGLRQGFHCLGCCWAMMLLMIAVGIMNVLWMVAIGIVMTFEKFSGTEIFSRAVGVMLIAGGGGFMLSAVWPF